MNQTPSRLVQACCALALLASVTAKANTTYSADFNSPTLDPALEAHMLQGGVWTPGVALPWVASTGSGYLALAKTFTLPGNAFEDGPHVQTWGTVGDFIATVTADSSYNGAGGAGFFMDADNGYTGFSFGVNWMADSAGMGYQSTGYNGGATPLISLQIKRVGNTLTKSYKLDGQSSFTLMSSHTGSDVLGEVGFDMTNYSNQTAATAVLFRSFTIESLSPVPEPESYAMLLAGLLLVGVARRRISGRS